MCQYVPGSSEVNTAPSLQKLTSVHRCVLLLLLVLPFAVRTQAQDFFPEQADNGIRIGLSYEIPQSGNLKDAYKAAPAVSVGYVHYFDKVTFSANLSYRQFTAKVPVEVIDLDAAHQSTTTTSPFTTYLLYISAVYNIQVTEKVKAFFGANLGEGYTRSSMSYQDDTNDIFFDNSGKQTYFAPKVGVDVALTNYLDLDIHAAYNMLLQGAVQYNNSSVSLGASASTYSAVSVGAGLVFRF